MHRRLRLLTTLAGAGILTITCALPAQAHGRHGSHGHHGHHHGSSVTKIADGLDGPRGVASLSRNATLVSQTDGTFSLVLQRKHRSAKVIKLGSVPNTGFAPGLAVGPHHTVYLLTGQGDPSAGANTLYRWRFGWHSPKKVANIAAYQTTDPDPYNLADAPDESNPYGIAALRDGSVLVADAAGNDLLRVWSNGKVRTVARLKPRVVPVPDGLPPTDPDGNPLPPAGTMLPSEAVATSVTVGPDGYWYVGELRGFPATPGTSQIWRIRPGSVNAVCDPDHARHGRCTRYADGLTSIVDLSADHHGNLYALSLSKMSWLQMELGTPGSDIGGLFRIGRHGHRITELARNKLTQPGGVDLGDDGSAYVTGPVFGPGSLLRIR